MNIHLEKPGSETLQTLNTDFIEKASGCPSNWSDLLGSKLTPKSVLTLVICSSVGKPIEKMLVGNPHAK